MICTAYRKSPHEKSHGEIVTLDTESGLLVHRDRYGKSVRQSPNFNRWTNHTPEAFRQWVRSWPSLWSLDIHDAYWFEHELELDEGL